MKQPGFLERIGSTWLVAWLRILRAMRAPGRGAGSRQPDVPFQPTPMAAVGQMLRLAGVHPGDVVYDLGSGDGRIVVAASSVYGTRAVAVDIDPGMIEISQRRARDAGVLDRIDFRNEDLFDVDISPATVVALFLWPEVTRALRSKLTRELKPGTRVVSYFWEIGDWVPDQEIAVDGRPVYLWTMPPRRPRESRQRADEGMRER